MRDQDVIEYLQESCICDPNAKDGDWFASICFVKCKAQWHWRWEVMRLKVALSLPKKFNPPSLKGADTSF